MVSLIDSLLLGFGPESEIFINRYVEKLRFLNTDEIDVKFCKLNECYGFDQSESRLYKNIPETEITKDFIKWMKDKRDSHKGVPVNDLTDENIKIMCHEKININPTKIIIVWKYNKYISENEKELSVKYIKSEYIMNDVSTIDINIMDYIYDSFNRSIKEIITKHKNNLFFTIFYEYLIGFDYQLTDNVLYVYPHFSDIYS